MDNPAFNFLTEQQARTLIKEVLTNFFSENQPTTNKEAQTHVVDLKGLIKARPFIGSESTVYKKTRLCQIPFSKQGKKLFFDLAEIDQWLLSNKIKTTDELEKEARDYRKNKRR